MFSKTKSWITYCLYDWANSPFATVIITFIFAVYFEKAIVGDLRYLGMIENNSRMEDYSGIGTIFSIADDRTFTDESTTGSWSVENDNFLVNNSFQIPFTIDNNTLVMSVDVTGVQYLRIYKKY